MILPSWRSVARARTDIEEGTFTEAHFAGSLGVADRGAGPEIFHDPVTFFEKTYLTDALTDVLTTLAARLGGDRGVPGVYRMQTGFGGGKTHTLLAAMHLFRSADRLGDVAVIRQLQEHLSGPIPKANVIVLDGESLPVEEERPGGVRLRSLLGQLAYRLGGEPAYRAVESEDASRAGSSAPRLVELLSAHSPCLILLDESLEYLNKARAIQLGETDLAVTMLTFIKELIAAVENTSGVALVATLTGSSVEDYTGASERGGLGERLERLFGRLERVIVPVRGDEVFPILQQRLFEHTGRLDQRMEVAQGYVDYYANLGDALRARYRESAYFDRLTSAYPFHPALIDLLTDRWASLPSFQRTRGALRILAHAIKSLCRRNSQAPLIQLADIDLADGGVWAEVVKIAPDYEAARRADLVGESARAALVDARWGGQVAAIRLANGLATTSFLQSHGSDQHLGASMEDFILGAGRPGIELNVLESVRDDLDRTLFYMRQEGGRYRFRTQPNLNRMIAGRIETILAPRIDQLIREMTERVVAPTSFLRVVPQVTNVNELPDDAKLTLGVLHPSNMVGGEVSPETDRLAEKLLHNAGGKYRTNKNAVMLLAADAAALGRARNSARMFLALRDLKDDPQEHGELAKEQRTQLDARLAQASETLPIQVAQAYQWLYLLGVDSDGKVLTERLALGPARAGTNVTEWVLERLRSGDLLLDTLGPQTLLAPRYHLLTDVQETIELKTLAGLFAQQPRLPKLAGIRVLRDALVEGVRRGQFALVSGAAWDADDAVLRFEEVIDPLEVSFQEGTFLVRARAAQRLRDARRATVAPAGDEPATTQSGEAGPGTSQPTEPGQLGPAPQSERDIRRVTLTLHGVPGAKMREIVKVAVLPLNQVSTEVNLDVTVHADGGLAGIPKETLDLVVLEGLRQLGVTPEVKTEGQ